MILGSLSELVLVGAAISTAIMLFSDLKKHNETIALGYVCFRLLEAVIITVEIIGVLALVTLSEEYAAAATPPNASVQASGTVLLAVHDWTFLFAPNSCWASTR